MQKPPKICEENRKGSRSVLDAAQEDPSWDASVWTDRIPIHSVLPEGGPHPQPDLLLTLPEEFNQLLPVQRKIFTGYIGCGSAEGEVDIFSRDLLQLISIGEDSDNCQTGVRCRICR